MKRTICLILGALLLSAFIGACGGGGGSGGGTPPDPSACRTSTSFEFNATGPFCIGTSPFTATFSSGVTQSSGDRDLYSSGNFAWHVLNGTSATVTFETLPSTLTFFVRGELADTVSDVQILDENDDLIMPVTPPANIFLQVVVNRDPGETLIGSVVVTSTSGGDVVIDDFVFVIN